MHILSTLGKVKPQKLLPQQLPQLNNQKSAKGYAPRTVKHIHRLLHRALDDAVRWGLVARNVCKLVDPPRVPQKEMQTLTAKQAKHFLEAAKSDPPLEQCGQV